MAQRVELTRDQLAREFAQHYEPCLRLARGLTGSTVAAEDAVQDAFLRFWEKAPRLREPQATRAYLMQTVVNNVRSTHRRDQHLLRLLPFTVREAPTLDVDLGQDLRSALLALPLRRRACVVLRFVLDLSEAETARLLGISVGAVKSQTSRGVAQLRAAMTVEETR